MKSKILHFTSHLLLVRSVAYSQSPARLLQALAKSKPDNGTGIPDGLVMGKKRRRA